ncbi:MAG TPA: glycosyltransferase family 4 protein [Candidatus Dormibacteraeota bacterium]
MSTLLERVPPTAYGGIERVVAYLTDELVRQGHDVTLYASGDSSTTANLVPVCPRALRLDSDTPFRDYVTAYNMKMMMQALKHVDEYDILHFHTGFVHLPTFYPHRHKILTTFHMPLHLAAGAKPIFDVFAEMPFNSISQDQQSAMPDMNWTGCVPHGIPEEMYPLGPGDGGYLLFVGRIAPVKRADRAIEIARRAGIPLKIAAKVDDVFQEYFEETVAPHIDGDQVQFAGEVDEAEKARLMRHARALLFPIEWNEPFGLVMIEAMASGTPVIATDMGSVPEVIENGRTGYRVPAGDIDGAVEAVRMALTLNREEIRQAFLERFTATRMAQGYVALYEKVKASVLV